MNLVKTSFYTSLSTVVTFICGFIVAKVVAVKIGPPGIAMVGQFQNTTAVFSMLGVGAINMGIVKYLAENNSNKEIQQQFITTAFSIAATCSAVVSLTLILSSGWLSEITFHSADFWIVFFLYGLFLTLTSFNTIFLAIYNGLKEIKLLTIANVTFSVTGIVFTILFAQLFGVKGVLVAVNANALVLFFLNLFLFTKLPGYRFRISLKSWNNPLSKRLFAFSLMSAVSTLLLPGVQLIVRNKIIKDFSISKAGYWQGVTRISDYYLTFIITVLSVYYLPRLSEINNRKELRAEIFRGYKTILPVVGLLAFAIWLFRHYVVIVLFSKEFLPMKDLFAFQLIGDFLKITSWLLGFLMWARAMTRTFIMTELIYGVLFVACSYVFLEQFGLIGATYAFALSYLLYLFLILFIMRKHLV